jgi:hypothetical protein
MDGTVKGEAEGMVSDAEIYIRILSKDYVDACM